MITYRSSEPEYSILADTLTTEITPSLTSRYSFEEMHYFFIIKETINNQSVGHSLPQHHFFQNALITIGKEYKDLENLIYDLSKLEFNWDGYGALSISQSVILHALNLANLLKLFPRFPNPEISPKPNGTLSFSWETNDGGACIEIGNTRFSGYLKMGQQKKPALFQGQSSAINFDLIAYIYSELFLPIALPTEPLTRIQIEE